LSIRQIKNIFLEANNLFALYKINLLFVKTDLIELVNKWIANGEL